MAVPGQVKEILFKQTAIGQGGVGKQEVTADHQIEAASIERQVGKAGCLVALGMDQSIGQKLLQGFEFAAAIGRQIEVDSEGVALANALQGEIDILQAALLDFRAGEGIERIHRQSLHAIPARCGDQGTRTTGTIQDPGSPPVGQIQVKELEGIAAGPAEEHHPRKFHGHGGGGGQRAYFQSAGVGGAGGGRRRSGARRAQGTPL